jgi:oligopeptide transport system permease protein
MTIPTTENRKSEGTKKMAIPAHQENIAAEPISSLPPRSLWSDSIRRLKKNKAAVISGIFISFVTLVAILAPWIAPYSFETQNIDRLLLPPDSTNWLGTDSLGRDMLSRIIYGARMSMSVAYMSSLVSLLLGLVYGAVSGWLGGRVDRLMMRLVDILNVLPEIVLLILVKVMFDAVSLFENPEVKALVGMFLALSITGWLIMARLVRGQVLQAREMLFVEAATALGVPARRIIVRHVLPNILGPIIVTLTFQIATAVLLESFLSFIGLGLQPPFSSWGVLANEGWKSIKTYPHLIIYPGIAIFLPILAFNFFGDGLRDAFDPKLKNRG